MLSYFFQVYFHSQREREPGGGGDNQRWQIGSLVTCVPTHFQVDKAFTVTGRPTVEARSTIAPSATNHLEELVI